MKCMKCIAIVLASGVWAASFSPQTARDQDTPPARAMQDAEHAAVTEARITDLAFLAGSWGGPFGEPDAGGAHDYVDEHWSAPRGGSIVGAFRWTRADGSLLMYEMLAITEEPVAATDDRPAPEADGAARRVVLRIRHFSPTMVPWEGPDDPMTLHLAAVDPADARARFTAAPGEARLTGVVYHRVQPDRLTVRVDLPAGRPPLEFRLSRLGRPGHGPEPGS